MVHLLHQVWIVLVLRMIMLNWDELRLTRHHCWHLLLLLLRLGRLSWMMVGELLRLG